MSDLIENFENIRLRIRSAAVGSGRDPAEIKLVAVSKTHPAAAIRDAIDAGCTVFGENKVQEAESKIHEIGRNAAEWHLIGHLQSNKARRAVQLFDVIHSVDSLNWPSGLSVFVLRRDVRNYRCWCRSILPVRKPNQASAKAICRNL